MPKVHSLDCYRRRIPDRDVLSAVFFILRTGCQWKVLDATSLCKGFTAHSRSQHRVQAGVFARLLDETLGDYNDLIGLNFSWLALDDSLHKAPLGGKINSSPPTDRAKGGVKCSRLTGARSIPVGLVLDGANRHDVKLVDRTLASLWLVAEAARDAHRAADGEQGLCRDAGYDIKQVRETLTALDDTVYIRPRGEEVQVKKVGRKARY